MFRLCRNTHRYKTIAWRNMRCHSIVWNAPKLCWSFKFKHTTAFLVCFIHFFSLLALSLWILDFSTDSIGCLSLDTTLPEHLYVHIIGSEVWKLLKSFVFPATQYWQWRTSYYTHPPTVLTKASFCPHGLQSPITHQTLSVFFVAFLCLFCFYIIIQCLTRIHHVVGATKLFL